MGGCTSSVVKLPSDKKFRRAIKLYEVDEVYSLTNLFNRNKCFENGESPLTLAAQEGHEAIVEVLVTNGADVNKLDRNGRGALHLATHLNDEQTVDILLKSNADPCKLDEYHSTTPLHIACERGFHRIAERLLEAGANVNDCGAGLPPLIFAITNRHQQCLEVLLKHKADVNVTDSRGNTALHIAVSNSDATSVNLLLDYGADPFAKTRDDDTLVVLATLVGSVGVLEALLNHNCDVNDHKTDEPPPLVAAVARGSPELVDTLIAFDANVNTNDKRHQSVLQIACMGIADVGKDTHYAHYFSNVYRMFSKYDPEQIYPESSCKCAMSLVQAGADVTRVWGRFVQVFPDPNSVSFEQLVLCEVLIQAYGFHQLSPVKIRLFIKKVIEAKEYSLLKLLFSSGVNPSKDDLGILVTAPEEDTRDTFVWVKKLLNSPRQLKDICRQRIRKLLSWNVLYLVEQLPLPTEAKEYICIMDTEHYSVVHGDS